MLWLLFCFTLIFTINLNVNGQNDNLSTVDKATLFGQFQRVLGNQVPISCYRIRANIKNAHPIDNTKYFICRDERRYEVHTCPNGGIFDGKEKACIDLCEQHKPCLNQGQCIILANLTLECVCRRDWTGERCEIPLSSCANNPCGSNNECRMLKATDYSQDYVCICDNYKSYGRNCQQTVPNPCLTNTQQFHPFAYSRRAYINCDDELIFFQPCNGKLYWSQEDKRCDRSLPLLLRQPFAIIKKPNQQNIFETTTITPSKIFHLQGFASSGNSQQQQQQNIFETTTISPSKIFHLQGFASSGNSQQQQEQQPQQKLIGSWPVFKANSWKN